MQFGLTQIPIFGADICVKSSKFEPKSFESEQDNAECGTDFAKT